MWVESVVLQTGTERERKSERVCCGVQLDDVKLIFEFEKKMELSVWE